MTGIGLILVIVWIVLVAGVRGAIQYRRSGTPALRIADPLGSAQWWSRTISSIGFLILIAASIARIAGMAPIATLDTPAGIALGLALYGAGIAITLVSQAAMGDAWRGDVDPDARADLVTDGPFRLVRNPIFTGSAITATGIAIVVANLLALVALACFLVSMQIQVRLVEEPHLLRVHGEAYRDYAARTGRFLPGVGRLRPLS